MPWQGFSSSCASQRLWYSLHSRHSSAHSLVMEPATTPLPAPSSAPKASDESSTFKKPVQPWRKRKLEFLYSPLTPQTEFSSSPSNCPASPTTSRLCTAELHSGAPLPYGEQLEEGGHGPRLSLIPPLFNEDHQLCVNAEWSSAPKDGHQGDLEALLRHLMHTFNSSRHQFSSSSLTSIENLATLSSSSSTCLSLSHHERQQPSALSPPAGSLIGSEEGRALAVDSSPVRARVAPYLDPAASLLSHPTNNELRSSEQQGPVSTTTRSTTWSSHTYWHQQFAHCRPIMKNASSDTSMPIPAPRPATRSHFSIPLVHAPAVLSRAAAPGPSSSTIGDSSGGTTTSESSSRSTSAVEFPQPWWIGKSSGPVWGGPLLQGDDDGTDDDPGLVVTLHGHEPLGTSCPLPTDQAVITIPRTYTHETASKLFVFAELTGARKRDIALNFEDGTLRVMSSRNQALSPTGDGSEGLGGEGANYMVTMRLPSWVDDRRMRNVKITFSTGLLELCIPKTLEYQRPGREGDADGGNRVASTTGPIITAAVGVSGIGAGLSPEGRDAQGVWRSATVSARSGAPAPGHAMPTERSTLHHQ